MNTKHVLTILAFLAILSVAFALPQMDHSSQRIGAGGPIIISSITSSPVPFVAEVDSPAILKPTVSNTKSSTLFVSGGLNGSNRSGLSENELTRVLNSSRRYNHTTKVFEQFSWGPAQRERIITSWIEANNRVNSSRAFGSKVYYNKEVK